MRKKVVLTVHGLNTNGSWQKEICTVLEPHFICLPIKHKKYKNLGYIKLVVNPLFLIITLILILGIIVLWLETKIGLFLLAAVLPIVTFVYALIEPIKRRKMAVNNFIQVSNKVIEERFGRGDIQRLRPHVIAHSLGTYLVMEALVGDPALSFDKIILTGCVLPSEYDWKALYSRNGSAEELTTFAAVRNEIGQKDKIPRYAKLVNRILPGFGDAGCSGFKNTSYSGNNMGLKSSFVHDVNREYGPCIDCESGDITAKIHNVFIPRFTHSAVFINKNHVLEFWLPFLWEIEPYEFKEFRELCSKAALYVEEDNKKQLAKIENKIFDKHWKWADGSLIKYVSDHLITHINKKPALRQLLPHLDELTGRAIRVIYLGVAKADASVGVLGPVANRRVLALHPHRAVIRAVKAVLKREAEGSFARR
jgi:hypothetical protein